MIRYENQSTLEAIYAINTILLVFISSILKIKSSLQTKNLKADLSDAGSDIYVSLDYNPLILAQEDRLLFFKISVLFTIGIILMSFDNQLSIFGLIPVAMNLKVRFWLIFECKIQNYVDMPSCGGFFVDILLFAIIAVAVWFGSPEMPLYSGVFIGWAIGELRILCSFKMVRDKL